jgi:hypothetical protein
MQFPVLDESALCFAARFYGALALGLSIDEAAAAGRVAVAVSGDSRGWATPVLYMRSPDGVIFPEFAEQDLKTERDQIRLSIQQEIGVLEGSAIGLSASDAGKLSQISQALGDTQVKQKVGVVTKTGSVIAVETGSEKQRRPKSTKRLRPGESRDLRR